MKRICAHVGFWALAALFGAGCLDFEDAHKSFCNQAARDRRIDVCGRTFTRDTQFFAGAVYDSAVFAAEGSARPSSLVVFTGSSHAVAGRLEGSADLGAGTLTSRGQGDIFVARYGRSSLPQWSRSFGGAGEDSAVGVVRRTQDVLFLGNFEGSSLALDSLLLQSPSAASAFLATLDGRDGTVQSATLLGGTAGARVTAHHLARSEDGERTVAVGTVAGGDLRLGDDVTLSGGEHETLWALGLDGSLGTLWYASATGCDFSSADQAAVQIDHSAFVVGRLEGEHCTLGAATLGKASGRYAFLAYFDASSTGAVQPTWMAILGQVVAESRVSVAVDRAGVAYVLADLLQEGAAVPTLFNVNRDAPAPIQKRMELHAPSAQGLGLASNRTGRVWAHGTFTGDSFSAGSLSAQTTPGANTFIVEVDPSGAPQWARAFHSDEGVGGTAMAWDPSPPPPKPTYIYDEELQYGPDAVGPILAGWFRKQLDVELPHKYMPAPASGENMFLLRFYTPPDQDAQASPLQ